MVAWWRRHCSNPNLSHIPSVISQSNIDHHHQYSNAMAMMSTVEAARPNLYLLGRRRDGTTTEIHQKLDKVSDETTAHDTS
jgi:hypothetical protein